MSYQHDNVALVKASDPPVARAAQARAIRRQRTVERRAAIREAATRLFLRDGYVETTMAAIAAEAGSAVQSLYLAFGSKAAMLEAAHDAAVVGIGEDLPVLDRPWAEVVHGEPHGRRALAVLLDNALGIVERVSPIYAVIQAAAADAEVGDLLARTKAQRLTTLQALAANLAGKRGFAAGVSAARAGDLLYVVVSDEQYRLLVIERGWPPEEWREWCGTILTEAFFPRWRSSARPGRQA